MDRNTTVAVVAAVLAIVVVGAFAAVDTPNTFVSAPGTAVEHDTAGTHVKAPFVDVDVPKNADAE